MKKQQAETLLMLPVFNEAETIESVLKEIQHYYSGDILLVDDGSTDSSVKKARALKLDKVEIIYHKSNLGYGQSIINGFDYSIKNNYKTLITIDCDAQHEPAFIPEFIKAMPQADIVSGSRYLLASTTNNRAPSDRIEINQIITGQLNSITDYTLTDAFCGFKAYKVDALKNIQLDEMGYGMPLAFLVQACCKKLSLIEIPVTRIYYHLERSFGPGLDEKESRLKYYQNVIKKEVQRCQ